MRDIAAQAGLSEQSLYNYFPTKQALVLDRADELLARYRDGVRHRAPDVSPARAVEPRLLLDVTWIEVGDPALALGTFVVLSVGSPVLRRFTLEFRERQAIDIAEAITATTPHVLRMAASAYAAALVAVMQAVADAVGTYAIKAAHASHRDPLSQRERLDVPDPAQTSRDITTEAEAALRALDRAF